MTRGVIMFAHQNGSIDYEKLARLNEKLVKKFLDVPVHIVTGEHKTENSRTFRFADTDIRVPWHNTTRMNVYDLSPFDQTLLLDVDYFIMSDNLNFVWDTPSDFLCPNKAYDVTGTGSFDNDKMLSFNSFAMRWCTCVYFTKSPFAEQVFKMMAEIKDNYLYYSHLFNFKPSPYRNDFALSIALQVLSGYQDQSHHFHFPLASLSTDEIIQEVRSDGTIKFMYDDYTNGHRKGVGTVKGLDLHIMNKKQIFDHYTALENFADG